MLLFGVQGAWARNTCPGAYARLTSFIEDGFSFDLVPKLTGKATIPSHAESQANLKLLSTLWDESRPDADFLQVVQKAKDKGKMKKKRLQELLEDRERLKALRFLCEAICTEGTIPKNLDRLIVRMGRLKDAVKFGDESEIEQTAKKFLKVLNKKYLASVDKEIKGLEPMTPEQLQKRISQISKSMRMSLSENKLTEVDYHELRKNVGRLQAIVMMNAIISNRVADKNSHDIFRQVFEAMGQRHNKLVKADLQGEDVGKIKVKDYEREQIEELLQYFEVD